MFYNYVPPTPEALARFKSESGLASNQIAGLLGLAGGRHWRKYTGGTDPRVMSAPLLFTLAAHLELDAETVDRVHDRMRSLGASFAFSREVDESETEEALIAECQSLPLVWRVEENNRQIDGFEQAIAWSDALQYARDMRRRRADGSSSIRIGDPTLVGIDSLGKPVVRVAWIKGFLIGKKSML